MAMARAVRSTVESVKKAETTVRLDVWLDVSCLYRTRSEAQRACEGGKIEVKSPVHEARGAAFIVSFPVERQPASEHSEAQSSGGMSMAHHESAARSLARAPNSR